MGLLDKLKRNRNSGFRYQIEDRFATKNGDTVVVGKVMEGRISVGDEVECLNKDGQLLFRCQIGTMEQPGHSVKTARAENNGAYGATYGVLIHGKSKDEFVGAAFLVKQ